MKILNKKMKPKSKETPRWWEFADKDPASLPTGTFRATNTDFLNNLYFPIPNQTGVLSWASQWLHGGPAISNNEYLAHPLTTQELTHSLLHRDFWITEDSREPFNASGLGAECLKKRITKKNISSCSEIEAGIGYFSLIRRDPSHRIEIKTTLWCPEEPAEPIEIMHVCVNNLSSKEIRFVPYAAIPLFCRSADNVRDHRHVTGLLHRVKPLPHGVMVKPVMSFDERGHIQNDTLYSVLAFGNKSEIPTDIWAIEEDFLGESGTFAAPKAVFMRERAPHRNENELCGKEAIGGFRFSQCHLAPRSQASYTIISGISRDEKNITKWVRFAKNKSELEKSLERTRAAWITRARQVSFTTADSDLNQWLAWVNVQPVFRRLYGNSYLPQFDYGRGGRGWRDLWQDCLALILSDEPSVRDMLLHNIGGVRIDGSNATIIGRDGSFIADRNNIPRTWMDHGAWPAYTILLYLDQTGDIEFLFEDREYFRDQNILRCRQKDESWTQAYRTKLRTRQGVIYRGSVIEHLLVQNLSSFFNVGEHNLCRLEGADWNDGLDMASNRGESVAFSCFYAWNLKRLADICSTLSLHGITSVSVFEELGLLMDNLPGQKKIYYDKATEKQHRLEQYLQKVSQDISGRKILVPLDDLHRDLMAKYEDLAARIRNQEWIRAKGLRFLNSYYDDLGRRVDGANPNGTRISLTGQVFGIMSGITNNAQIKHIIRSCEKLLKDPSSGGMRLNSNFKEPQFHLGRAFSFSYGDKENGAVFSHMAVMYAYALYLRRYPEAARKAWHSLYSMAIDRDKAKIFPCLPEYFNKDAKGMYCYLTGSASWLVHLLLTQAYGIRGEAGYLIIDPQLLPEDFKDKKTLSVETTFAKRRLLIRIENPKKLNPRDYAVTDARLMHESIPYSVREEGGIKILRGVIERFYPDKTTAIQVTLGERKKPKKK